MALVPSKLLSGISEALQPVSIGLRNCHPARFQQPLKPLKTLPAALPWDFPRPHELFLLETAIWQCFCWASKLLSGISEAPRAVSIGVRNCYLARFQHPLKPCHVAIQLFRSHCRPKTWWDPRAQLHPWKGVGGTRASAHLLLWINPIKYMKMGILSGKHTPKNFTDLVYGHQPSLVQSQRKRWHFV